MKRYKLNKLLGSIFLLVVAPVYALPPPGTMTVSRQIAQKGSDYTIPLTNVSGIRSSPPCYTNPSTGDAPPDIHGAAGPGRLVVVTNTDIGVYNKTDCRMAGFVPLLTLFRGVGIPQYQDLFDPRVIYDQSVGRFFVTVESRHLPPEGTVANTDQYQYFAVSKDSSGSAWRIYRFTLSQGTSFFCKTAPDRFWDYPQAGKSAKRWLITGSNFAPPRPTPEKATLNQRSAQQGLFLQ